MIVVESKRKKIDNILKKYPNAIIADVTSHASYALRILSPFYPHGDIPVPYTNELVKASCVESIWQGLKVFENEDIDISVFNNATMSNIKRTTRKHGKIMGHKRGPYGSNDNLLSYIDARKNIYIVAYRWMIEHHALSIIDQLREADAEGKTIVLLDYNTNCDINDTSKPLSHAYLVKAYAQGLQPFEDVLEELEIRHYYCGRKTLEWTTKEKHFKNVITQKDNNGQLTIEFDVE